MNESSGCSLRESPPAYGPSGLLDLPDWSGQVAHRSRVPTDEWLAYCRANLSKLRTRPGYVQSRLQHGIGAEFSL